MDSARDPAAWAENLCLMVSWVHALCSSSAALLRCVLGPRAKLDRVLRGVGQHPAGLISDAARVGRVLAQTLAKLGPSEAKRFFVSPDEHILSPPCHEDRMRVD